uniref:ATP synthase CF1 epsilon subunit n=1 Tax=Xyris capensis TaxID=114207 RepID=UPI001F139005|nr:ATP synthase CF1 epsilon subunit [Xyris capensis]ULQ68479.1 ATP synthase CF1 epsilon subunit [Xyris capensis]ULQ68571.1 ATP synthase CF1 epsilon subunit [Xyris capensis]
MSLYLSVLTPNRIFWDSEVKEIILSTNSGQIGILPNHISIFTSLDIGLLKIRLKDRWLTAALMGGFAKIVNNEIIVFAYDGEMSTDIDPKKAQQDLEIAGANLNKAEDQSQKSEANLAFKRAKTRVEAVNTISF